MSGGMLPPQQQGAILPPAAQQAMNNAHRALSGFANASGYAGSAVAAAQAAEREGGVGNTYEGSPDARVEAVLEKYRNIEPPPLEMNDMVTKIFVCFDNHEPRAMYVPCARMNPARIAVLWPFELMEALGITYTVQERWMQPLALSLEGGSGSSEMIPFVQSHLHEGQRVLPTSLLHPGATYVAHFEDRREDLLAKMSEAVLEEIQAQFNAFDTDHSGYVSRHEIQVSVLQRTMEQKATLQRQCAAYVRDNPKRAEDAQAQFEESCQKLDKAQNQLMDMFQKADVDGNGMLDLHEYILAEAWWRNSAINPNKVNLF